MKNSRRASLAALLLLLLALGGAQFVRSDSISGAGGGTSIDAAVCVTTTANSLCDRVADLATADLGAAITADSALARVRYTSAIPVVRPAAAAGVSLSPGASAWANPASYTEIIPANSITTNFILVAGLTTLNSAILHAYEIELGTGAAASETSIGTVLIGAVYFNAGPSAEQSIDMVIPQKIPIPLYVAANTRVAARLRSSSTSANLVTLKLIAYPLPL